jgi:hypothetical protein
LESSGGVRVAEEVAEECLGERAGGWTKELGWRRRRRRKNKKKKKRAVGYSWCSWR